jgi:hypothetical protein
VARLSNRLVEEFFKIRRIVSPDPPGVFFVFFLAPSCSRSQIYTSVSRTSSHLDEVASTLSL